ncbi:MAG: cyclic nucleotide-binding domain-containing protein [Anaerolineales bacterium]|nr:cyclic nucleotide-binding domain-containing protein [Anaerolineales bacterium]
MHTDLAFPVVTRKTFAPGETIIRQDTAAQHFFIILTGEVDVVRQESVGSELFITRLGPGDYFGEIGLLEETPRTATVRAYTAVTVLRLDQAGFLRWLTLSPTAPAAVQNVAFERRQDTSRRALRHVLNHVAASRLASPTSLS